MKPDLDALLKRATFIVATLKFFYVKRGAQPTVIRFRNTSHSMLTDEAGNIYMAWKDEGVMPPRDVLRAEVDVEQRLLHRVRVGQSARPARWRSATLQSS